MRKSQKNGQEHDQKQKSGLAEASNRGVELRTKIQSEIARLPATDLSGLLERRACVAVILRGGCPGRPLEIGYIRRAISPLDRWSGQMAFPGGKEEEGDLDDFATARRETFEETGIQLSREDAVGRLHDIQARKQKALLDFYIRPLVFYADREFDLVLDPEEVAEFFWVPVARIEDPNLKREYSWSEGDRHVQMPAIEIHGAPPLWGLTYFMTQDLVTRIGSLSHLC